VHFTLLYTCTALPTAYATDAQESTRRSFHCSICRRLNYARARPSLCRSCVLGRLRPCRDGKARAQVRNKVTGQALHARRGCLRGSPPNRAWSPPGRLPSQLGSWRQSPDGWAGKRGHQRSVGARAPSSSALSRSSRHERGSPRAAKAPRQLHTHSRAVSGGSRGRQAKALRQQLTVGDRAHKRRTHRSRQHVSE